MALQKSVNAKQPLGFAGQVAKAIHSNFQTLSCVAVDDNVRIGEFVQSTDQEGQVKGVGQAITGTRIAGLVIFENFQNGEGDSNVVNKGDNVTLLTTGSAYIRTSAVAKQGQAVLIKVADGSLVFNDTKTLADHLYTGFVVEKGNSTATDGIVLITTAMAYV